MSISPKISWLNGLLGQTVGFQLSHIYEFLRKALWHKTTLTEFDILFFNIEIYTLCLEGF